MIYACSVKVHLLFLALALLLVYAIVIVVIVCVAFVYHCMLYHSLFMACHSWFNHGIILMHASHSYIIVTQPSENKPVEPTESVEPEPGVEFVVESEANQGKQLCMIPCAYLNWCNLDISLGYYWVIYIMLFIAFSYLFYAFTFIALLYPCPCHL